jgi:chromate transporter
MDQDRGVERVSAARLAWAFLRIGAVAFGGLGATLAPIESELVQRQKVSSKDDVTEALTYTKLLPGSTVVQVVAYLGWRLGGWRGSVAATACFILPSAVLMTALAYGYSRVAHLPALMSVRRGVLAAVVALLLLTLYRLARPVLATPLTVGLAVASFAVVAFAHVSVVFVVVTAGIVSLIATRWQAT